MTDTVTYTIYGASDDLVEVETSDHSFSEEYYIDRDGKRLFIQAPTGESLEVHLDFGAREWEINLIASAATLDAGWRWPIVFGNRPDAEDDPAILITAPVGTRVTERAS